MRMRAEDAGGLRLLPVESRVHLTPDGIDGIITGIWIEAGNHIHYRVAWWNGRTRCEEWVEQCEVQSATDDRQRIGFVACEER